MGDSQLPTKRDKVMILNSDDIQKVWDLLHVRNTGDIGFEDLRQAIVIVSGLRELAIADAPMILQACKEQAELIERLLKTVQATYRKHVNGDDSIGWDELGDMLHSMLRQVMGDDGFIEWDEKEGEVE